MKLNLRGRNAIKRALRAEQIDKLAQSQYTNTSPASLSHPSTVH